MILQFTVYSSSIFCIHRFCNFELILQWLKLLLHSYNNYSVETFLFPFDSFFEISFITSLGFIWDNNKNNIPIESPIFIKIFKIHTLKEYPLVINLLHLLLGSGGKRMSKDVLCELWLIILFVSIVLFIKNTCKL